MSASQEVLCSLGLVELITNLSALEDNKRESNYNGYRRGWRH